MSSPVTFFKYEALGNDFIIIDEMHSSNQLLLDLQQRIRLCDRHRGIGADGIITLFHSKEPDAFAYMHITNADGSIPEMCGNGFRCAVQWLIDEGKLPVYTSHALLTDAGIKPFRFEDGMCTVEMGIAEFTQASSHGPIRQKSILLPDESGFPLSAIKATAVSMGNPHLVIEQAVSDTEAKQIGSFLEHHPAFPNRTNVEFVTITHPTQISLKVWERGVGLTKACGTGACAAVAALVDAGKLPANQEITTVLPGGELYITAQTRKIAVQNREISLHMTMKGSAERVFVGVFS